VDLVIWNEDHAGYRQVLHDQIMGLIAAGIEANVTDRPGGIFVRPADQISNEDRILIQTVARAILTDSRGVLADQINRHGLGKSPCRASSRPEHTSPNPRRRPLCLATTCSSSTGWEDSPRMGASTSLRPPTGKPLRRHG